MNRFSAAGSVFLIAGILLVVAAGEMVQQRVAPCADIILHGKLYLRLSIGPQLPIPTLQHCRAGATLFAFYSTGYVIAACGTLVLMLRRVSPPILFIVTGLALGLAIFVPFLPNTDPYAYALYAYEGMLLHATPYELHQFTLGNSTMNTFAALFGNNSIEKAANLRISNYGPVFNGLYCLIIGPFGLISLKAMIVAERVFGALLVPVLGWMVSLTQKREMGQRAFIGIALNPLLIFESISFAHGDIIMLTFLAGAYLAFRHKRLALCVALCVAALETRGIAVLALLVVFRELYHRRDAVGMKTALLALFGTGLITVVASILVFGHFSIGTAYGWGFPSSPATILATWLFGKSDTIVGTGTIFELGLAGFIGYVALRERLYALMPIAGLAALPIVAPWYLQWVAPAAVLTSNRGLRAAMISLMLIAPIQSYAEFTLNTQKSEIGIVSVEWLIPLLVYVGWQLVRHRPNAPHHSC